MWKKDEAVKPMPPSVPVSPVHPPPIVQEPAPSSPKTPDLVELNKAKERIIAQKIEIDDILKYGDNSQDSDDLFSKYGTRGAVFSTDIPGFYHVVVKNPDRNSPFFPSNMEMTITHYLSETMPDKSYTTKLDGTAISRVLFPLYKSPVEQAGAGKLFNQMLSEDERAELRDRAIKLEERLRKNPPKGGETNLRESLSGLTLIEFEVGYFDFTNQVYFTIFKHRLVGIPNDEQHIRNFYTNPPAKSRKIE